MPESYQQSRRRIQVLQTRPRWDRANFIGDIRISEVVLWQAGSSISPPHFWYHQHFNTGNRKARRLAMTQGDIPKRPGIPLDVEQIEANREDPTINRRFERQRRKAGNAAIHLPHVPPRRRG